MGWASPKGMFIPWLFANRGRGGGSCVGWGAGVFCAATEGAAQKRAAGTGMANTFRDKGGKRRAAAVSGGSRATGGSGAGNRQGRRGRGGPGGSGGPEGRSGRKGRSGGNLSGGWGRPEFGGLRIRPGDWGGAAGFFYAAYAGMF
jgi:hypothetical protein